MIGNKASDPVLYLVTKFSMGSPECHHESSACCANLNDTISQSTAFAYAKTALDTSISIVTLRHELSASANQWTLPSEQLVGLMYIAMQ